MFYNPMACSLLIHASNLNKINAIENEIICQHQGFRSFNHLPLKALKYFCITMETKARFKFEIILNDLVRSFRLI